MAERPSAAEITRRKIQFIAEEQARGAYRLHWLSFADPTRPKGTQFLGVVLIWAKGFTSAVEQARAMGLNPGGEVHGQEFDYHEIQPGPEWWNRRLTRPDTDACEADRLRRYEQDDPNQRSETCDE